MGMLAFTEYTYPDYRANWHHKILCEYLDRWAFGDITRLMVFAPPQHGKSELVSRRLPAYVMGRDPDAQVVACSYAAALASRMNRDTQRIIDDDAYRNLFPETTLHGRNVRHGNYVRNSDMFEIVDHKGAYRSAGVNVGITGMGMTHGIIDDPVKDDKEAYSPAFREATAAWYRGTFYTRLRKDARILLTMTRWHREDLAGILLEQQNEENADQWTVLEFEGVRSDHPNPSDPRKIGEPLWDEFKSHADLVKIKATLGKTRYAAMYDQRPRMAGGAEWGEELFGPQIWFDEWPKEHGLKVCGLDPSKGTGTKWGDDSAFAWIVHGKDGKFYIDADMANDRHAGLIIDTAIDLQMRWNFAAMGIETNEYEGLLCEDLLLKSGALGITLPIVQIASKLNKQIRIRQLTPLLASDLLRFKGGSPGARKLVAQLMDFPNGDHDDGPDALHMAVETIGCMMGARMDGLGGNLVDAMGGVM